MTDPIDSDSRPPPECVLFRPTPVLVDDLVNLAKQVWAKHARSVDVEVEAYRHDGRLYAVDGKCTIRLHLVDGRI